MLKLPERLTLHSISTIVMVRGAGVVIQFLLGLAVARVAGATGIGFYQLYNTWMITISDAGGMGLSTMTLREVARMKATNAGQQTSTYVLRVLLVSLLSMTSLAAVICAVDMVFTTHPDLEWRIPDFVYLALLGAILFSLFRILVEAQKSEGRSVRAVALESVLLPGTCLLLIVALWIIFREVSGFTVVALHTATILFALAVALYMTFGSVRPLLRSRSCEPHRSVFQRDVPALWGGVVLNMLLLNLPFYVLPVFLDVAAVGRFAVPFRLVAMATTLLVVIGSWYGPRIASASAKNETDQVRRELAGARLTSTILFVPYFIVCVVFGRQVLSIFGTEFVDGYTILVILSLGQLVNAVTGLPGLHLNMSRNSHLEVRMATIALAFGSAVVVAGGILYGITGIAVGFSLTLALKNLGSWYLSHRVIVRAGAGIETKPGWSKSFTQQTHGNLS